ncbi:membrane bound o-acyl transferase family protein [Sarocladium implicatum]|nr:membrane bound o-acyl transferase family protein [Sarocladium implicatum]
MLSPHVDFAHIAHHAPYWATLWLMTFAPPALLLILTPKTSPLRWLWIPPFVALAHALCLELITVTVLSVTKLFLILFALNGSMVVVAMLGIVRPDSRDLAKAGVYRETDSFAVKFLKVLGHFQNYRAVGTVWQSTRNDSHPRFLQARKGKDGRISVKWFIARQAAIAAWQWLFLDVQFAAGLDQPQDEMQAMMGDDYEFKYRNLTQEQWMGRIVVGVALCLTSGRIAIDLWYRITSIAVMALGLSTPEIWPPLYGSMFEAYTIRGCWSSYWHQYLRWPLTTLCNFITKDLLRLPSPSIPERCVNTILVFFLAGVAHIFVDYYDPLVPSTTYLPGLAFFVAQAVGIILEDSFQQAWRYFTGTKFVKKSSEVPLWRKIVGYAWVFCFFAVVSPWYLYPKARLPFTTVDFAPYHITPHLGLPVAGGLFAIITPMILFGFGGEL